MNIELSRSELNTIRHALVRLDHHNKQLVNPFYSAFNKEHYTPEQLAIADLELDVIKTLLDKIPTREELEKEE